MEQKACMNALPDQQNFAYGIKSSTNHVRSILRVLGLRVRSQVYEDSGIC